MTKRETLLEKARQNPKGLRFDELILLTKYQGWVRVAGKDGSHQTFEKEGKTKHLTFQPAPDGKAHAYQVKQLLETISEERPSMKGGKREHS